MGFLDDVFDGVRDQLDLTPRVRTPPKRRRKPTAARRDARVHVQLEEVSLPSSAPPPSVGAASLPVVAPPPPSGVGAPLPQQPPASPLRRPRNLASPPKARDGTAADADLVKRANRLASVAASLDSLDLEAIARAHRGDGASSLTAAAAAAAALNSAIACAVGGEGPDQVRRKLEKRAKAVQRTEGMKTRRAADVIEARRRNETLAQSFAAKALRAADRKRNDRDNTARHARAARESSHQAAASRRDMAAAKTRLGYKDGAVPRAPELHNPYAAFLPPGATSDDDPLLKRARALRDTAARIAADLSPDLPVAVVVAPPARPVYAVPPEEAELVARAKALLADYEPQAPKPRPSNFEYGQLVTARRRRADASRGARAIGR